jgi:hypothetical protein
MPANIPADVMKGNGEILLPFNHDRKILMYFHGFDGKIASYRGLICEICGS